MLSHEIIKHKPTYSSNIVPWVYKNTSDIQDQAALDLFLQKHSRIGDVVTFSAGGPVGPVYSLHQLNTVVYIKQDFNSVKVGYDGKPETHMLLQLGGNGRPWFRWVNPVNYHAISQEEKDRWLNDFVQNYIETAKAASEEYQATQTQP